MKNKYLTEVKPFFSDKGVNSSKITLVEKNVIVVDEEKIANITNNYFISITKNLNYSYFVSLQFLADIKKSISKTGIPAFLTLNRLHTHPLCFHY